MARLTSNLTSWYQVAEANHVFGSGSFRTTFQTLIPIDRCEEWCVRDLDYGKRRTGAIGHALGAFARGIRMCTDVAFQLCVSVV